MSLKNKVALITGGASGIGLATALVFLREGIDKLALLDLQESSAINELRDQYIDVDLFYVKVDVTSEEQVRDAFHKILDKFGLLDIVVHSAGILDDQNWSREIDVNLKGTVIVTLASITSMGKHKSGKGGSIVHIASINAVKPNPLLPFYSATKSAVLAVSRSFGSDIYFKNTGVSVMAVCPAGTYSAMVPATPERFLDYDFIQESAKVQIATAIRQSPESVGKCVVEAILSGENGSVWISKDDLPGIKVQISAE